MENSNITFFRFAEGIEGIFFGNILFVLLVFLIILFHSII